MNRNRHGVLAMPADERVPATYLEVRNLIKRKVEHPVADFVTRAIERQVELEDLQHWGLMSPDGELRPDLAIPEISKEHGNAVWRLINAYLP